jgi:hypothetical protein
MAAEQQLSRLRKRKLIVGDWHVNMWWIQDLGLIVMKQMWNELTKMSNRSAVYGMQSENGDVE